jgi:hypothetical protein
VEDLLHPEAGGRAVEETEEAEVVVLGGVGGESDDRGVTIRGIPAFKHHKVIMSRDRGVSYFLVRLKPIEKEHRRFMPRQTPIRMGSTKG